MCWSEEGDVKVFTKFSFHEMLMTYWRGSGAGRIAI